MTPAEELLDAAVTLTRLGLNSGTSGNLSVRLREGFLVTPSAIPADSLSPRDMVAIHVSGEQISEGVPSSEWRIHRDVYATFPEAGAIVHTHSVHATALASLREDLPPFHYLVGRAGGHRIACSTYATFGTQALSDAVVAALGPRRACLMSNHGMLAYGSDLASAVALAAEVELLCEQYLSARSAGTPVLLSEAEMDDAIRRFARYGSAEADA